MSKALPEFSLSQLLLNAVSADPTQTAIVEEGRPHSYAELLQASAAMGGALAAQGVRRGDRVGVLLDKSWQAVVTLFGVSHAGAAFVPISSALRPPQIEHIVRDCGVRLLVTSRDKAELYGGLDLPSVLHLEGDTLRRAAPDGEVIARLDDDTGESEPAAKEADLGGILYTSGSTGLPKGIMLSQHNLVAGAQIVSTYLKNTPEDRLLSILPFHFDYGLSQLTTMVRVGGTLVLQRSLFPGDILQSMRREEVTGLAGVPSVWVLLLQAERSLLEEPLGSLRYVCNSGGMVPTTHLRRLQEALPTVDIYLMYGLTEAFRSTYLPPGELWRGPACIGRAIPNTDVWVLRPDGTECAVGEEGELVHRGPTVALGYWGHEEKTSAVYKPNPLAPPELRHHERVVFSGDVVRRDDGGYLYYVGRRDELIKIDGHRISPQEVEELLHEDDMVHEAAAFGRGNVGQGQSLVAVLSLREGVEADERTLRARLRERAPHYMIPKALHVVDELPKTSSGKTDRSTLRRVYAGD